MKESLKFLIIDDEQLVRRGLKHTVPWEKYNMEFVGEAPNGLIGYELYEKLQPDIIITDIVMPKMSGIELAHKIREHDPRTRILFLSCHGEFAYAQQGIRLGATGYILKTAFDHAEMDYYLNLIAEEAYAQRERLNHDSLSTEQLWHQWMQHQGAQDYEQLISQIEALWPSAGTSWISFSVFNAQHSPAKETIEFKLQHSMPEITLLFSCDTDHYILCCHAEHGMKIENHLIDLKKSIPALAWRTETSVSPEQVLQSWINLRQLRQQQVKFNVDTHTYSDFILEAITFIEQHLQEELTTAKVADHVQFSRSHFSTIFKKETGENLSDFIHNIRLDRARLLLQTTDWGSSLIAQKVGIHSYKYFSKWFKQNTGETPTDYRKRMMISSNKLK